MVPAEEVDSPSWVTVNVDNQRIEADSSLLARAGSAAIEVGPAYNPDATIGCR